LEAAEDEEDEYEEDENYKDEDDEQKRQRSQAQLDVAIDEPSQREQQSSSVLKQSPPELPPQITPDQMQERS